MSADNKRFGVYADGVLMYSFDDVLEAYDKAKYVTEMTKIPCEVKVRSRSKVIDLLRQIRENKAIIEPFPQFIGLDVWLKEFHDLFPRWDEEGKYSLQVFTDREKDRDDECFVGISYGIKLVKDEEVKWKKIIIQGHDSALVSDIANFYRAMPLQICNAIALYFQQGIYKWTSIECKIVYDFKMFDKEAFEYNTSDYFVKNCIFDKEYGDKIATTLSGWR
ncbi:hypothetical protein SIM20_23900 [Bacillus cereus group sp. BfR-BA-02570]|uniref:hypothetical protein n=1 Tax=Bacillus cereus group sp. BfR-BA-02570 TaxID=3094890 RepID=UPI0029C48C25|nr:hypothetical protein [Bacillus cereus group sp. BfR-BA-02570]MDX5746177.1 hypothetical protein [Bacillus cereus group sp. BfR-BA-02570]